MFYLMRMYEVAGTMREKGGGDKTARRIHWHDATYFTDSLPVVSRQAITEGVFAWEGRTACINLP